MRLSGRSRQPSSGIGTPQSRSRVMARGCRSSSRLRENLSTLGRQPSRVSSHFARDDANAGRSRKKCSVSTNSGVSPLIRDRGLISCSGSSWLPQLSHWSPRALSYPDRKSTRLNSSHVKSSYAVFCLKKKKKTQLTYFLKKKKKQQTEKT